MFEKILVPVDGSEYAKHAVRTAAELARCHDSSVFVLHVIRDLVLPKEIVAMIASGEITVSSTQILQDSADIILDSAEKAFAEQGITKVERDCLLGDPASMILQHAQEKSIDLIVLGHRGLGPTHGLLGGVARKLVNMTEVSVLIAV